MTTAPQRRSAIGALYAGLGRTTDVLAQHVRAGYSAYSHTSGDTGLPPLPGRAGMLPSLAGLVAVTLMWRRQ